MYSRVASLLETHCRNSSDSHCSHGRDKEYRVMRWIGENRFIFLTPILGCIWSQIIHGIIIVAAAGVSLWYFFSGASDFNKFLACHSLPPRSWYCVLQVPLVICLSGLKIAVARHLLHSDAMIALYDHVGCGLGGAIAHMREAVRPARRDTATDVENIRHSMHRRILLNLLFCPVALVLMYIKCRMHDMPMEVYCYLFVPLACSLPAAQVGNTVVYLAVDLAQLRIRVARSDLELYLEPQKDGEATYAQIPDGFFTKVVEEYEQLDDELSNVFASTANLLILTLSQLASVAYVASLSAMIEHEHPESWCTAGVATIVVCGCIALRLLFSLADTSCLCHSEDTLRDWDDHSLFLRVLHLGKLRMSPNVTSEYLKLINIMRACPIGVKFPWVGLLRSSDIIMVAKSLVLVTPVAITWSLTRLRE